MSGADIVIQAVLLLAVCAFLVPRIGGRRR
ncbi:MAG: hypothetical protein QOF70_2783 [Acetobacteraceae bacterium]|jgi:hypothetical protein|nr:hypothetical protein [Acetobacteraceae bacterium]